MKYCVTMEKTVRVAEWFDADSDEEALVKGNEIVNAANNQTFEGGEEETNYAISADDGRTISDWG